MLSRNFLDGYAADHTPGCEVRSSWCRSRVRVKRLCMLQNLGLVPWAWEVLLYHFNDTFKKDFDYYTHWILKSHFSSNQSIYLITRRVGVFNLNQFFLKSVYNTWYFSHHKVHYSIWNFHRGFQNTSLTSTTALIRSALKSQSPIMSANSWPNRNAAHMVDPSLGWSPGFMSAPLEGASFSVFKALSNWEVYRGESA